MCPLTSLWREKSRTIFHWQTGNNGGKRAGQHLKGGTDFPRETNPIFWKASLVSKPTKVSFCFTSSLESLEGPRKSFSLKEELDGLEEWTKLILLSLKAYFVANGFARLPHDHLAVGSIRPTCGHFLSSTCYSSLINGEKEP